MNRSTCTGTVSRFRRHLRHKRRMLNLATAAPQRASVGFCSLGERPPPVLLAAVRIRLPPRRRAAPHALALRLLRNNCVMLGNAGVANWPFGSRVGCVLEPTLVPCSRADAGGRPYLRAQLGAARAGPRQEPGPTTPRLSTNRQACARYGHVYGGTRCAFTFRLRQSSCGAGPTRRGPWSAESGPVRAGGH